MLQLARNDSFILKYFELEELIILQTDANHYTMPHMLTQYDGVSIFRLFTFQS
jgi:predicted class III extradiol MEMO1 family dioxygenase